MDHHHHHHHHYHHVSQSDHPANFCLCSFQKNWLIDTLTRNGFATSAAIFGVASNLFTILILSRVLTKSATEKLLLAISVADLILPLSHLTRGIYISFDKRVGEFAFFRIVLFYLWHVFSVVSILLTLLMAARRYIAIVHPHLYTSFCLWERTKRMVWAVCAFAVVSFAPVLFHNANPQKHDPEAHHHERAHDHECTIDTSKEILYASVIIGTLRLGNNYLLAISYWLYVFAFQLLCPLILALLSIKFTFALNERVTSTSELNPKLARVNAKTKLILIVSLLSLIRDLPLGLLTLSYMFVHPLPACLTTMRLLTKEFTIILSATNFVVLYFTNEKFMEAVSGLTSYFPNRGSRQMKAATNGSEDTAINSSSLGMA